MRMRRTYHAHDKLTRVPFDECQSAFRQPLQALKATGCVIREVEIHALFYVRTK